MEDVGMGVRNLLHPFLPPVFGAARRVKAAMRAGLRPLHIGPGPMKHKVGRNDRCPCGSGKKYKKCCGR